MVKVGGRTGGRTGGPPPTGGRTGGRTDGGSDGPGGRFAIGPPQKNKHDLNRTRSIFPLQLPTAEKSELNRSIEFRFRKQSIFFSLELPTAKNRNSTDKFSSDLCFL